MAFDPEKTFILSKNDKGNNPKRPDYRGQFTLEGKTYELAGWIREKRSDGSKFISGSVKLKEPKQGQPQAQQAEERKEEAPPFAPAAKPAEDEDVPF